MGRYKIQILSVLCGALFMLQGCVHGTLDECPPMVQYAVAFTYTNHTGKTDRFYDDVKKINLFVFDENNLIYTTTTEISPYETNFNIPLDLPMGKYHIIAWGNVLDDGDFTITPETFEMGVTTLDQARLYLNNYVSGMSSTELENLFYGELDVDIPLYISRVDTIPLTNNTNQVRVVCHWDHSGILSETDPIIDYKEVLVRLYATNAVYNFGNTLEPNTVTYLPYATYYTDSILRVKAKAANDNDTLKVFYYSDSVKEITNTTVYDFSVLRMMVNNPIILTVQREKYLAGISPVDLTPAGGINIIDGFEVVLTDKLIPGGGWQNAFDKYGYYRIDLYFTYDHIYDSFATGGIHVLDWHSSSWSGGGVDE